MEVESVDMDQILQDQYVLARTILAVLSFSGVFNRVVFRIAGIEPDTNSEIFISS